MEEGTLILPKRSPFARRFPRWVSAGATKREVLQTSRRVEPVTRVPEASKRRARANRSKNARSPSLRRFGPRFALSTQVERNVRKHVACGPWLAGPRCGNVSRRPTQLASVGAGEQRGESPTRVRGSVARRVCPRIVTGCRSRQAPLRLRKSTYPLATGRVNGSLARTDIPGDDARVKRWRKPEARWPSHAAGAVRSRTLERALRGKGPCSTEDTSDRSSCASFTRAWQRRSRRPSRKCVRARAPRASRGGDRGVRGAESYGPRWEDNAHRGRPSNRLTCSPPKRIALS